MIKRQGNAQKPNTPDNDPNSPDNVSGNSEYSESYMYIMGPSRDPLKYSSAPTRSASLHPFMGGAEFNEVNQRSLVQRSDEIPENLALRFQSNTVYRDIPSQYPGRLTAKKIANRTFDPADDARTWKRNKGEPTS